MVLQGYIWQFVKWELGDLLRMETVGDGQRPIGHSSNTITVCDGPVDPLGLFKFKVVFNPNKGWHGDVIII